MKVYLAGKIPKGGEIAGYTDWRAEYKTKLAACFDDLTVLDPNASFAGEPSHEEDAMFRFGCDAWMIKEADAVIVNAEQKLGLGTSQELIIAKYFTKPVVTVLPKESHHRRSNMRICASVVADWIHPFIGATSDAVVENADAAVKWLADCVQNKCQVKDIRVIDEAVAHFLNVRMQDKNNA